MSEDLGSIPELGVGLSFCARKAQDNSDVIGALLSFTSVWDAAWKRALLCVVVGLGSFRLTAPIFLEGLCRQTP